MVDSVNVRNLDQIQEVERGGRAMGMGAWLLGAVAVGGIATALAMTFQTERPAAQSPNQALQRLVADAERTRERPADEIDQEEISFPELLSDHERPTTAIAAVKDGRGRLIEQEPSSEDESAPHPAGDKLPVVPLPAGTMLNATPVTTEPKDPLTQLAKDRAQTVPPEEPVLPGGEGGYQIQVASFRDQADADALVSQLLERGHRAFRQAAYVPERGLWHRVRIGPFKYKHQAKSYQDDFEKKERMTSFLVDPDKVKRQQQVRAAKLAARVKKYGRP